MTFFPTLATAFLAACAAAQAPSAVPASGGAAAAPPEVAASTPTPSSIYTAEKLRDPFLPFGGGGGGGGKTFDPATFSIHNLVLRGIMKDSAADYALFSDSGGMTFILRRGKLYDPKNKPIAGVSGQLRVKQKWAQLSTPDGDVQIFRLGQDDKE